MRSPLVRRVAASALAVILVGGASGCAALPGASSPAPTSTATTVPDPTQSATSAPTESPTSPQPTATDGFGGFAAAELAQICIDATLSAFPADVAFTIEGTRIEQRLVSPEWLVLVPAQAAGLEAQAQCTIGGTPSAPQLGMSSASLEPLPEEQIENLIRGENEGGDR